ncbi:hypothetical protein [Mycolicibacterium peregrinum]|uniref:hypothetical protein n=1 Tax=Mycolicibacterium peregrinum TaxID=43304 RepID=UPI0013F4D57B|nr:hypothetical protein [Mycolicibacterium peregrinum]
MSSATSTNAGDNSTIPPASDASADTPFGIASMQQTKAPATATLALINADSVRTKQQEQ